MYSILQHSNRSSIYQTYLDINKSQSLCSHVFSHTSKLNIILTLTVGFPGDSQDKPSDCNAGHLCAILGSGRSTGDGNGNPLLYSCLENSMDGGAWLATVHGITKSCT